MGSLIEKGKIGERPARLIATVTASLTVFPAAWATEWLVAVIWTALFAQSIYFIFWAAEEIHKKYHLNHLNQ